MFFIPLKQLSFHKWGISYGPSSLGGHVESQENKKLCVCTASLVLNSRLGEAGRAKTFYSPETQHDRRVRMGYWE